MSLPLDSVFSDSEVSPIHFWYFSGALDHFKNSSQEKAVLPCNFGIFHNKKGEKNCIVLSPCCIKTTWAYLEWSSTTLVNKTLTKRIWFKFGDVVEPVWRVWTFLEPVWRVWSFFGAVSELSVMLKGAKESFNKNKYIPKSVNNLFFNN